MKKLLLPLIGLLLFNACQKQIPNEKIPDAMGISASKNAIDIDENFIPTVTICNQTWMQKNLDVPTYRNGDPIPQVTDPTQWANLTTGAWCYYNNDPANRAVYGKLYNWYAVNDPRGLAPAGWHIPSDAEWTTLESCLGGNEVAGGKMKEAGTAHWRSPNTGATNSSGFTALPGGYRGYNGTTFQFMGNFGIWWSATAVNTINARDRYLKQDAAFIGNSQYFKQGGYSVRCLKNNKDIPVVTICKQTWMQTNLDVSTYRNGDPIPQVTDPAEWDNLTTGAWCYFNNDPANGAVYGKLYNWFAVNDSRGLAPAGWHVPGDEEWTTLSNCLGGISVAGGAMKETGTTHWISPNTGATNRSGFTGLPGGIRMGNIFTSMGKSGYWWSSTAVDVPFYENFAVMRSLYYETASIIFDYGYNKAGLSVRCLKD